MLLSTLKSGHYNIGVKEVVGRSVGPAQGGPIDHIGPPAAPELLVLGQELFGVVGGRGAGAPEDFQGQAFSGRAGPHYSVFRFIPDRHLKTPERHLNLPPPPFCILHSSFCILRPLGLLFYPGQRNGRLTPRSWLVRAKGKQ